MKTAAELFEQYMEDGQYPRKKFLEKQKEAVHTQMKNCLKDSEAKRIAFDKQGMVAKFINKGIYHTHTQALNEYLYQKGLLPYIVEIDSKKVKNNPYWAEELEDFQHETSYFVAPYFNKKGRALINKKKTDTFEDVAAKDLLLKYSQTNEELERVLHSYEIFKEKLMKCAELRKKEKVTHQYGSLKLRAHDPTFDNHAILHELGEEVLIEYGKPNNKRIQKVMEKGLLTKAELNQFKTLMDHRLDFVIMTLEAEARMFDHLNDRAGET
ncbi:hypothetical protein [Gracilibacillus sp. YIM 98692]|uniref:hypothetical protein n=1 Tax=Gracilibacillus sp. YIM 98692 TaxID=2663532 RepID=UPI0013D2FDB9|nr:hypothetical protein [Gracilibacillus sp. YIM 98692]